MAPSFVKLSAAALACAVGISATGSSTPLSYQLADSYNKENFFDKFDFFTVWDPLYP